MRPMAASEPQKQLLSLIRDFASENSQRDRKSTELKKRFFEVQADLDSANADLEGAKRSKETAEKELKGSQVQLGMSYASILAQQTRISLLQEEIVKVGCDLASIKNEEEAWREEYTRTMCEFNTKIRQFQEMASNVFQNEAPVLRSNSGKDALGKEKKGDISIVLKDMEDRIMCITGQMHEIEREYQEELHDHDKILREVTVAERRWFLIESVLNETKQLHESIGQTSELEKSYASLAEELQRRYICPRCQFNNMGDLEETSQT